MPPTLLKAVELVATGFVLVILLKKTMFVVASVPIVDSWR